MKHAGLAVAALSVGVALSLATGGQRRPGRDDASAMNSDRPSNGSLVPAPAMSAARAAHTATALPDGRILIAGGFGEKGAATGAEVYQPDAGRFSPTGSMTVARESHMGVRLLDGRTLILGGHRGRRADITLHSSAEIYNPTTGAFTRLGDMGIRRHKHDAVLLRDGQVLTTGGSDERDDRGVYDSSELFDPRTGAFTAGPTMRLGRYKHAGTSLLLPSGLVLVARGAPRAETYDPLSRTFTLVAGDARMAGQFSAVAPLKRGGALITGGYGNGGGPRASAWLYQR